MRKRSFEEIEEEMKQLSNAYEAPFEEQAWVRMEALLDKDKDRKRPPFFWLWWLLPIFLGGIAGGYYLYNKSESKNEKLSSISKNDTSVLNTNNAVNPVITNKPVVSEINSQSGNADTETLTSLKVQSVSSKINSQTGNPDTETITPLSEKVVTAEKGSGNQKKAGFLKDDKTGKDAQNINENLFGSRKKTQKSKNRSRINVKAVEPLSDNTTAPVEGEKQAVAIQVNKEPDSEITQPVKLLPEVKANSSNNITNTLNDSLMRNEVVIADTLKKETVETVVKKEKAKANKNNNKGFYILGAIGADAVGVKLFSFDKITEKFGIAVGYQFSNKLSVQAGFFTGNKKYIAGPGDYKVKAGTYWSQVDMKKIDAICRVYEIPVLLRYDFLNRNKSSYFITAGLSSYIMKKEDYHYYYYRYGSYYDANASYSGNRHLFSVLRVGAGFERRISGPFSLQLSPGVSVPLAGVGEGEVKLFSTDLMIGLKFMPNRKK